VNQAQEQTEKNIALAAGYAVLLRRDGYTHEEVKTLIKETYQLTFEDAEKAWQSSLEQHAAAHKKIARETVLQITGQFAVIVIFLLLYAFIWSELNNYVAIIIYLIIGFIILGLLVFIKQYLTVSLSATLDSDISDNNKLASFAPILVTIVLMFAGMYIFGFEKLDEKDGTWINNAVVENYGERSSTKGKSPSWFTILRLKNREDALRYFDSEKQYALFPIDSFSLESGTLVDVFVADRSSFSFNNHADMIINIRQKDKQLTSLKHRNRLVNEANEKRLLYTSIFSILYILTCVMYGRYLNQKKLLSAPLTN
jgi:hypothetical protein